MQERKQKEIEYYDKRAEEFLVKKSEKRWRGGFAEDYASSHSSAKASDFEGFTPLRLSSFRFLYSLLKKYVPGKLVLDYGCGNGIHSISLIKFGAKKVIGIDLSEKSLELARKRIEKEWAGNRAEFIKMDCEKLDFPDNHFDLILDGGTFSSLDLNKALPELKRVLKPEGCLIGIETFGHNPLTNLKRTFNKLTGKRTGWAAEHIFREESIKMVKSYFNETSYYYFHLISWLAFPFLGSVIGNILLSFLESIDKIFLRIPSFKKHCFKVVFIFK